MSDIAIRVEHLSKRYRIGARLDRHATLRDRLAEAGAASLRRLASLARRPSANGARPTPPDPGEFWALKDVSFEVKRGEVLGVIGRNGAGKSTLLKILSRITKPTSGRAEIHGRVGSLLEVGTGFHPELTGRENIYLNGAILGMRRAEIARKFDEIVDFAEVEQFIDTPVKRYSSGMYVRLAFAVAAHLEPEILLVDEVLAVGDAEFQRKCLGRMSEIADQGRTVIFVSHNLVAVEQLCQTCIWLTNGRKSASGEAGQLTKSYAANTASSARGTISANATKADSGVAFTDFRIHSGLGDSEGLIFTNSDVRFRIGLRVQKPLAHPACGISIENDRGILMTSINTAEQGRTLGALSSGDYELDIVLGKIPYLPGTYSVSLWMMNPQGHVYALAERAFTFAISQSGIYGTRQLDHRWGCVYTDVGFELHTRANANTGPARPSALSA